MPDLRTRISPFGTLILEVPKFVSAFSSPFYRIFAFLGSIVIYCLFTVGILVIFRPTLSNVFQLFVSMTKFRWCVSTVAGKRKPDALIIG